MLNKNLEARSVSFILANLTPDNAYMSFLYFCMQNCRINESVGVKLQRQFLLAFHLRMNL